MLSTMLSGKKTFFLEGCFRTKQGVDAIRRDYSRKNTSHCENLLLHEFFMKAILFSLKMIRFLKRK